VHRICSYQYNLCSSCFNFLVDFLSFSFQFSFFLVRVDLGQRGAWFYLHVITLYSFIFLLSNKNRGKASAVFFLINNITRWLGLVMFFFVVTPYVSLIAMPSMTETIVKDPQPHERYHRGLARSAHCAAVAIVRRRRPRESAMAPDPDPTRENATSNASWLGVERGCSSVEVNAGLGRLGGSAASATRAPHAATAGGRGMRLRQARSARADHPSGPALRCAVHAARRPDHQISQSDTNSVSSLASALPE
jgi:hypothetical protein